MKMIKYQKKKLIKKVIQKDVNNYIIVMNNGKIKLEMLADKYLEERKKENLAGIDQRIASAQASYEDYCARIEAAKMTYKLETEKENFFTKLMAKILGDKKDATQLSGIKAQEYQEAEASRSLSRKLSSSASSDIFSYAISAADEAYYKHDLVCQRSLAEAMMG